MYDNYWGERNAENRATKKSTRFYFLVAFNVFLILAGCLITGLGTYGSIKAIIETYAGAE